MSGSKDNKEVIEKKFTMISGVLDERILPMEDEDDPESNCSTYFQFLRDLRHEFMSGKSEQEALEAVRKKFESRDFAGLASTSITTTTTTSSASPSSSTQWFRQFRENERGRKFTDMFLTKKEQTSLLKAMEEGPQHDLVMADVQMLYTRGLEAHQNGRYREAFSMFRPCLPFWSNNVLVWMRISEACLFEFYEETWDFGDTYSRLFQNEERIYVPSHRRQMNELRPRHPDMNMKFAECATNIALAMAKHSKKSAVHFVTARNHVFFMIKLKKYNDAVDTLRWIMVRAKVMSLTPSQNGILFLYKSEILLNQDKDIRAIEQSMMILELDGCHPRIKQRAQMICVMAYIKNGFYKKAYSHLMALLNLYRLDDNMLENVALLGVQLAHKMRSNTMFKHFIMLLQEAVY